MQGEIHDDATIPRLRAEYERLIESDMREQGYVPILDLDTQFSLLYNEGTDTYEFDIVVYGVFVGKKKAHMYEGFSGQNLIPKQ